MLAALLASAVLAAVPAVGETAPDFSAKDVDGAQVHLSEWVKQGTVILVFFPRAFTPG